MPRWVSVVLALAACLGPAGCGSKPIWKYRIAVIPKGLTHEHWQSVHRGADRAAADLAAEGIPVEVKWDGPLKESDALEQIGIIDRNVGAGVSGLVLAPQHSQQMVRPVQDAVRQNVPVVILDSNLDKDTLARDPDLIVKYVATNNYNGGKLAAEHLLKVLREKGKPAPRLVLLRYDVGSESTEQREQGFLDHINKVKAEQEKANEPALRLVDDSQYAGATVDTAEKVSGPLLTRLGGAEGIDGIFAVNESATSGMLNALRSQGLNKKIPLMGFDSSGPLLQALEEDDVVGLIVQDPYRMGYLGVWALVKHLEGFDVCPDHNKELGTGEYVLTRENVKAPSSRELFDPAAQKLRTIVTPPYEKKTTEDTENTEKRQKE
jgi:ribose transport system substrate-binding protein